MRRSKLVAAMTMWRLEEDSAGLQWEGWDAVVANANMMEGLEPEAADHLQRAVTGLDGTSLDMARKGLVGKDFRLMMGALGLMRTDAANATQGVTKLLSGLKGICAMWKAFTEDLKW